MKEYCSKEQNCYIVGIKNISYKLEYCLSVEMLFESYLMTFDQVTPHSQR